VAAWLSGNGIAHINEVILRQARLVLGWVTVREFNEVAFAPSVGI